MRQRNTKTQLRRLGTWRASPLAAGFGRARVLLAGCAAAGALLAAGVARATIVERVVAVVGDKAILLSDLHRRAAPFESRLQREIPDEASRTAALSQLYKQLVERLVDEELQGRAATRSDITVSNEEVQNALDRLAKQNDIGIQELYDEAQRSGLDPGEYRQEIRRQLLDAKMLNLRVQGRLRVSEDDMRAAYQRLLQEERQTLQFRAAWIRFQIQPGSGASGALAVQARARRVANAARRGADFAELARQHSSDPETRQQGGLLEPMVPAELPDNVAKTVMALEPGDVSEPVRLGDAWLVIHLVERSPSSVPPYEEAKPVLQGRVYQDKMQAARRQWLDGLRKQEHVDIRL